MKKKLYVLLMSLAMVVTMMPLQVFADTSNAGTKEVTSETKATEDSNGDSAKDSKDTSEAKETEDAKTESTKDAKKVPDKAENAPDYLNFKALDGSVNLSMDTSVDAPDVSYEYTRDREVWNEFIPGKDTVEIQKDEKIYLRAAKGDQVFPGSPVGYLSFRMEPKDGNGKIEADGNIMSLVSQDCDDTSMQDYGFYKLFWACKCLTKAPKLTATYLHESCYAQMFGLCDSLIEAPELPVARLSKTCYQEMFLQCTSLVKAPKLPAEPLAEGCYSGMFERCTSLTEAPELLAKELAKDCYSEMFAFCSSLTKAPDLLADKLAEGCYNKMFESCLRLETSPELQAKELAKDCCDGMFLDCLSLTKAPVLAANELAEGCYKDMFKGCTSLVEAPNLPAEKLAPSCYATMFSGCSGLNKVNVSFADWDDKDDSTKDWLKGVANEGTFTGPAVTVRDASHVPENWEVVLASDCLSFKAVDGPVNLSMDKSEHASDILRYEYYSVNAAEWKEFVPGQDTIEIQKDETIYFRAYDSDKQDFPGNEDGNLQFVMTPSEGSNGKIEASGNIMSLISRDCKETTMAERGFYGLFLDCTCMVKAPKLTATTLAKSCYESMFKWCTNLTDAPDLPATELKDDCYKEMFFGCGMLKSMKVEFTKWPSDSGYSATRNWLENVAEKGVFDCSDELDVTVKDGSHVPAGWTAAQIPYLKLTAKDGDVKVSMKALKSAPDVCYEYSRDGKKWGYFVPGETTLTIAQDQKIYLRSFDETQLFPGSSDGYWNFVMEPVNENGKIEASGNIMSLVSKDCSATDMQSYGFYGLFNDCKALINAPELPAKTLAEYCYSNMFEGCVNLTKAPDLFAKTLTNRCYNKMFRDCTSLNNVVVGFTDWDEKEYATEDWLFNVASEGKFISGPGLDTSSKNRGPSHIPSNWILNDTRLSFRAVGGDASISMGQRGEAPDVAYEYLRENSKTWEKFVPGQDTIKMSNGEMIFFRAAKDTQEFPAKDWGNGLFFVMKGDSDSSRIEASGNIMALVSQDCSQKTMESFGFYELFTDCSIMTTAPALTATELADYCYSNMFAGCSALMEAPKLPATTLKTCCYEYMFQLCSELVKAPDLPAEKLEDGCYYGMFSACTKLNYVKVGFTEWVTRNNPTANWLASCADKGVVICPIELDRSIHDEVHIPVGWDGGTENYLSFKAVDGSVSLSMAKRYQVPDVSYEYSKDKKSWSKFVPGTTKVSIPKDQTIYLRAAEEKQAFPGTKDAHLQFVMNDEGSGGKIEAGGDITSLLSRYCVQTDMQDYGFDALFSGCRCLSKAPDLPEKKLARYCYANMFEECKNLTKAPALYADTLAEYCCANMFYGCSSLTKAPNLPVQELITGCYSGMFKNCSNLNAVHVGFPEWKEDIHATENWLEGVAQNGSFTSDNTLDLSKRDKSHLPVNWNIAEDYLRFKAVDGDVTIAMRYIETPRAPKKCFGFEYSFDKSNWKTFDAQGVQGVSSFTVPEGDLVYIRDNSGFDVGSYPGQYCDAESTGWRFAMSGAGEVEASGNIMSLVNKDCSLKEIHDADGDGFMGLFKDCDQLIKAPRLPATTLEKYAYYQMFEDCDNLREVPQLSATTMDEYACAKMFKGCVSLSDVPKELPATEIPEYAYAEMFKHTSLIETPYLPAQTLSSEGAYSEMFDSCRKLKKVTVALTKWPDTKDVTHNWLSHVSDDGLFVHPGGLEERRGECYIPESWKINTAEVTFENGTVGGYGGFYDIYGKKIESLQVPLYSEVEVQSDDKDHKNTIIFWWSHKQTIVQTIASEGFKIAEFHMPESRVITSDVKFRVVFEEERANVSLSCDEGSGSGGYYIDDKKVTSLDVPYHTSFETQKIDDRTIEIAFDCGKKVTVKADEGSVIGNFVPPESKIEKDCKFRTSFFKNDPSDRIKINFEKESSSIRDGDYYLKGITKPITDLHVPKGTTFETRGKVGDKQITINFKSNDEVVATVYVRSSEGSEIGEFTPPEGSLEDGSTFTTKFDAEKHVVFLASDKDSTGTGGYFYNYAKISRIVVPCNSRVETERIDDKTLQITFDDAGILTVKADEGSLIENFTEPKSPIASDCIFRTKFMKETSSVNDADRFLQQSSPQVSQVTGISAKALNAGQVQITWNGNGSKDTSYQVYASTKKDGKYTKIGTVTNGKTKYIQNISPAQSGKKYYYKVRASVKDTTGKWKYGTFSKVDYAYPRVATPTNFKAWASNKNTCNCSWNKVAGSNIKYLVYRGTKPKGNWGKAIATTTKTSYTNKSMKSGQKYYYMIRAVQTINGKNYYSAYSKKDYAYPR